MQFFKEEVCNKMACSCGALMCYLCKKPVEDYTHFYEQVHLPLLKPVFSGGIFAT